MPLNLVVYGGVHRLVQLRCRRAVHLRQDRDEVCRVVRVLQLLVVLHWLVSAS